MRQPISLGNFLKMTPSAPQYSPNTQHYLVAGANPTYYLDNPGIEEMQAAPLIASFNWASVLGALDGNVIAAIPSSVAAAQGLSVFIMTSTSQVFGIDITGASPTIRSLGFPTGSAISNVPAGELACVNGYLYATIYLTTQVYRLNNFVTPTWTGFGSITIGANTFLTPFLEYCMITDISVVKKIDSSFNFLTGINLGTGWQILGTENYSDKYMAIAGVLSNFQDYTQNFLFLWNGISDRYNYSMRIPGNFIGMKMVNGVLKVAVRITKNKASVFYLKQTSLVWDFDTNYSLVDGNITGFDPENVDALFNFKGDLGIRLKTNSDMVNPLLVHGTSPSGPKEFIFSYGKRFSRFSLGIDGMLYGFQYVPGGIDNVVYYPDTATSFQSIIYKSAWIPAKNAKGIDIWYETPPANTGDAINITILARGENITNGFVSTVLTPITKDNYLTRKRTRLDLQGYAGDFIKIELSTVNTSTWQPIIRAVNLI